MLAWIIPTLGCSPQSQAVLTDIEARHGLRLAEGVACLSARSLALAGDKGVPCELQL